MKILVLFYSCYGHVFQMAKAVAEGAKSIDNMEVTLKQVPETLSADTLDKIGASQAKKAFADIAIAEPAELADYDAIIFGAPTRYGMIASQMKAFIDGTGALWAKGTLIGKIGSVFTSSATQHGGQESTILSMHTVLLHQGMMIVGLPYSYAGQSTMEEISGNSPYGASTIAGPDGSRTPNKFELDGAFFQGAHVARMLARMK
ncbi:MAG: NAD(P)H:quinone oxidoreductase [Candidatus Cloacimonetes bacterium]|jgi:NAD(P)H dehydrogenase (quinone)|nr:NAD(P)H:quinone oxidoreductase [Candidatus Cloacimonadota bacterium]MCB5255675.1 NAD(P)H:quinone oxidoreductase [Candidatus Cloacimonadota bacterium]MCK9178341.1 NAD(P)H:quinone oxidoreductase [Candidatus Cloacimonadota bacterium]MCK9241918.1 NAD(P)H:quinone oxidoreductase [Candidatus Cloacimonadota bacterium]MDD3102810.1 NAD(P)H:quinone oxidoreductase [Candidatus Cloacimonadota bacterium]